MSDLPFDLAYFREPDLIDAPVALPATSITDEDFVANWSGIPEAVGYRLEVSESPTFSPLFGGAAFAVAGQYLIVDGIDPETTYFYRVRAVKASGALSDRSNVIELETLPLFTAQGGDLVTYDGEYSRHYFENDGDFEVVTGERRVRRLLVGGGGQGGGVNGSGVSCGGGGGGGVLELLEADRDPMTVGVYPVVIGAGGDTPGALNVGEDGGDTTFDGDTAEGGGHGGSAGGSVGSGGSGGGATNSSGGPELGGAGTPGQGYDGGDANAGAGGGAGGGGGGGLGEDGTGPKGGDGGDGYESDITGDPELYGPGGGGAARVALFEPIGATPGFGGDGGGGVGRSGSAGPGGAATGIGAGGGGAIGNNAGGVGTKGIVILKYRGRALDITPPPPPPDPPISATWRGPVTLLSQVIDGVTVDVIFANLGPGAGEFQSYDNPILGQKHTPGMANDFNDGFPYPAYNAYNTIGFKFSHQLRRFRVTLKTPYDHLGGFPQRLYAVEDIAPDGPFVQDGKNFYGEGYAANGGVAATSSGKYTTYFGEVSPNRREVRWVSGDSFKAAVVADNWAAWGGPPANPSHPNAMAHGAQIYGDVYFLLATDPEAPDEDLWEPP